MTISSRQNPWFKRIREAIRDHAGEIVIEGPKPVADAIAAGWKPIKIIERDVDFSSAIFDAIAETKSPQNVIALFERPRFDLQSLFARESSIVIALDGVQDPGNVGTIVRLAAAFDANGVALLPGCADAFGPKAIRSSAGAILTVPVVNCSIDELLAQGWDVIAADTRGELADPPFAKAILAFGSEGSGLSPALASVARMIAIRMSPRIESLNVASSAAILLARSYELR
ncbi:MAG: RNA methyltransferase [Acidobacteria bacterium]|nr:RNA methyltransferase [Acidobacteriota bacterium]MBV9071873.1 RNA methyltransferase [Acidobacteriota bacterium]MBV9186333.1 RNA methyltransferase [Acidobacteriota bacterium]